jgi:adenine-specific DNA-methyltransferase
MQKLKLHSPDLTQANIDKLAAISELFPNCVTESQGADGEVKRAVDFDQLRQELSATLVEGPQERYQLNWPGKREALLTANAPIAKTLRPCRAESVDFDTTQNLFIEGDNLDALKLLQETYLNKVKMIYIDPPYNTGKDFIYEDDFAEDNGSYFERSNQVDAAGQKLVANTEANGRFHSDWLSMMYSRLKLARNLLRDDGVIFISIDDNEVCNLSKVCDEIFGTENLLTTITVKVRYEGKTLVEDMNFQKLVETVLVYAKVKSNVILKKPEKKYDIEKFEWFVKEIGTPKVIELGGKKVEVFDDGNFVIEKGIPSTVGLKEIWATGTILDGNSSGRFFRDYLGGRTETDGLGALYKVYGIGDDVSPYRYFTGPKKATATKGKYFQGIPMDILENLDNAKKTQPIITFFDLAGDFGNCRHEGGVDFRSGKKPLELLNRLFNMVVLSDDDIILDFFAGSGTTGHATIKLNSEDEIRRKFICVQLAEPTDDSEFKTIAEITKERLRRAGNKIKTENALTAPDLDIGFRVLKIDSSNMKEVFYTPDAVSQDLLSDQVNNIREDRTSEDLLFQVLLDWGVDLSLPISQETIDGKPVFFVDGNALAACFETDINEDFVKLLAKRAPLRVVFRDAGFASDSVKINVEQIFKLMSPGTEVKTI